MQKILLLFLLPAFSCSKKETKPVICYDCEMTYANGDPAARQYPCTKDINQWQQEQKDNTGALITSSCISL